MICSRSISTSRPSCLQRTSLPSRLAIVPLSGFGGVGRTPSSPSEPCAAHHAPQRAQQRGSLQVSSFLEVLMGASCSFGARPIDVTESIVRFPPSWAPAVCSGTCAASCCEVQRREGLPASFEWGAGGCSASLQAAQLERTAGSDMQHGNPEGYRSQPHAECSDPTPGLLFSSLLLHQPSADRSRICSLFVRQQ